MYSRSSLEQELIQKEILDMTFHIRRYPIFEKGTFQKLPDLFDRFAQNSADYLLSKYERAWQTLTGYEEVIRWPLLTGPGFYAATHPGADNVFMGTMVGIDSSIYNSDCLYANPARKVFAVSDAPGITTSSRRLFEALDRYLKDSDDIETIVNRLNREMRPGEGATLSLVYFPANQPQRALTLIAGDTLLLHGNEFSRTLKLLPGNPAFMGTPYACFKSEAIELTNGDFFIIASDGIFSIKGSHIEKKIEDALLEHVDSNGKNFVLSAMTACNQHFEQKICNRAITRFGGNDNVSLFLVYPEKLADTDSAESFILGGETQCLR